MILIFQIIKTLLCDLICIALRFYSHSQFEVITMSQNLNGKLAPKIENLIRICKECQINLY